MNRDEILDAIRETLRDALNCPRMDAFGLHARLNEELYLDSIQMLQLFLNLELKFGLAAPEEALGKRSLERVSDLVDLFDGGLSAPEAPPAVDGEGVHGDEYYDIKVHCVVSCLCSALKDAGIDHRPFYFAVWDADFTVTDRWRLRYHDPAVSHDFFRSWFRQLYGVAMREWYDPARSKDENVATLLGLIENRRPSERVMTMLDMFHLPERENKFNQNPFPHYLMLEADEDPALFRVLDPDFRWEGKIARETVVNAVRQPTVGGGYVFDRAEARPAADRDIRDFFGACFRHDNPFIGALRAIVSAHLDGRDGVQLRDLPAAVAELPVLSIRKYAYEHGFAYFWRAEKLPAAEFEVWCEEIDALFQGLKAIHYAVLKLAETGDRGLAPGTFAELDRLDALETRIKARLAEAFDQWRTARGLAPLSRQDSRRAIA